MAHSVVTTDRLLRLHPFLSLV